MDSIIERIKRNPALVVALVSTAAALLMAFGLPLTAEQVGAITAFVNACLALAFGAGQKVAANREARKHVAE